MRTVASLALGRRIVRTAVLGVAAALSSAALAAIEPGSVTVSLEPVVSGLTAPVGLTHAGDGTGRLFVVDQVGRIRVIAGGELLADPFLDIADRVVRVNPFYDERGLLGLAFHPQYAQNGRFFVRYSAPRTGVPGDPCLNTSRGCHAEVLAEYHVSAEDPNRADRTERVLLRIDKPQFNHNGGDLAFGPDGMLYVPFGDGGGANDGLADRPPSHGPIGNGQNLEALLGKVLRLDVDSAPAPGAEYAIPKDNPFVGRPGRDEVWAYGFRNPYRVSFDDETGALLLPDVGQNLFEEVNVIQRGGNYGWVVREALHCFDPFSPTVPPASCPDRGAAGEPLLDPVAEYDHTDGIAVVGGFVYRGTAVPALRGKYVFGDFSRAFAPADGRLFYIDLGPVLPVRQAGGGIVIAPGFRLPIQELQLGSPAAPLGEYVKGFGRDAAGELYVMTTAALGPSGNTGKVYRFASGP